MKKLIRQNGPSHAVAVLCTLMVLFFNPAGSQTMTPSTLPLIPAPQSWQPTGGSFLKSNSAMTPLVQHLVPQDNLPSAMGEILEPGIVDESYKLTITPQGIELTAHSRSGLFRGSQTVRQLMVSEGLSIPCGIIEDYPGFRWRGMLLDCARHFMPMDVIKETIDQLAYHKFNVLHWHLTEDQGWRLEVPGYPRLTEVSAWRQAPGAEPYGGYYTADQVKEIVAYAAERFITVVPEIELPGHSVAAIAAYPELSCTGNPLAVETQWGIFKDVYCAGKEETFEFLENVLTHTLSLFPSRYIHIGGDECPKDRWAACPRCQERIAEESLRNEDALQSWFIRRIEKFLVQKNRQLIGWDEILEGGLAPNATVQSWRGVEGAIAAVRQGHDAIVSPTSHCYFDADPGRLDLRQVYTFNPRPKELTAEENHHILGGEMNLWSEYIPPERLQNMLFPRMTAMAECLWTDNVHRDFPEFLGRLRPHLEVLEKAGIKPGPTARPITYTTLFSAETMTAAIQLKLDPALAETMEDHLLELRHRAFSTNECPNFHPARRVEDMQLPAVQLSDPLVPENLMLDTMQAEIVAVQLFMDGLPYGTPAVIESINHLALGMKPSLLHAPDPRYPGGGPQGLCNGVRGTRDFRDNDWSGFEGVDFVATLEFDQIIHIKRLSIRCLQLATVWIWMPDTVEFQISDDGITWQSVATIGHNISPYTQECMIHSFAVENLSLRTKHVRVLGKTVGVCPDWHPGSGGPCWIFTDEIIVQ